MANQDAWRLILSPAAAGPYNMALDEAILEAVVSGQSPPTLRLYAWAPPCLSLGVAQPASDVDRQALNELGWGLVRRPTGGRAILHTDELTYAVIAGSENPHVAGGILSSYRHLSQGLLAALAVLGLETSVAAGALPDPGPDGNPVCFETPSAYEITADSRKLIGSAQVRRRGGVLQHGTLPLQGDLGRITRVLQFETETDRQAAADGVRQRAVTVGSLLGAPPEWSAVADAFRHGFAQALGLTLSRADPTSSEVRRAGELADQRYGHDDWTFRI
jgi:lipoate-protein ligase A